MKKIIIITVLFSNFFFSSCTLNTEPLDFLAPEYYYNTEDQCNNALTGIYDQMNYQWADYAYIYFDTADQMYSYTTSNVPYLNNYFSDNSWIVSFWARLYVGIERANMLLANIDGAQIDETRLTQIKGEAKFLRAFYYFMLVQFWGDVPLKLAPTASASDVFYPRTPASEVYDFVYNEMAEAEGMVLPITEYTYAERVSRSAVQGILARVCLYMAGWPNNNTTKYQDALIWSEKVIKSGLHSLNPSYSDVFINLIQDKYDTQESIWEIGFKTTGTTDSYFEYGEVGNLLGILQNTLAYGSAAAGWYVQHPFWQKYAPGDNRRDWAISPYVYQGNNTQIKVYKDTTQITNYFVGKYRREYELTPPEAKQKRANGTNFPLLRYADVLLMAAEAENEVNGPTGIAHQYLNEVRTRANASTFTGIPGKEEFRAVIQDERSRELCFEGLRRMDLRRWGILIPHMKALSEYIKSTEPNATFKMRASLAADNLREEHLYFPIPQREITLNPLLTQNTGW